MLLHASANMTTHSWLSLMTFLGRDGGEQEPTAPSSGVSSPRQ